MELIRDHKPSTTQPFSEPNFRLVIKRNYKGEYGFEYSVKGETEEQIQEADMAMQKYLFNQGLIEKKPQKNLLDETY